MKIRHTINAKDFFMLMKQQNHNVRTDALFIFMNPSEEAE